MQMMVETRSGNSIKTLKAVIDGKLLTMNVLGQHLSLLETRNFHKKQTNIVLSCDSAQMWNKACSST